MKKTFIIIHLTLLINFLFSNVFALDIDKATNAYFSLQSELNQLSVEDNRRSISAIILEGYVVSGTSGLILASKEIIYNTISSVEIRSMAHPLYEEGRYGLYSFQGFKMEVWYVNNLVSVITLMQYAP